MKLLIGTIIASLLLVSCSRLRPGTGGDVIVRVGNETLKRSDLEENIAQDLSSNDSILAAEHFIKTWIMDVLMYEVAEKNTTDMLRIDHLVENYRKSLMIYQYQEQLVNEKVSKQITDQELAKYYEINKDKFRLDKFPMQGIFLTLADSISQNSVIPFRYAKTIVREMLVNQRKIDFLQATKDDMYQRALDKGEIQFYKQ
ncbi:MAG: hypothetical protein LBF08_06990 [Dysgonamonadaceae bacterium]|nr:hypothetical protein [Dysgonamonadaceae bacterium]